MLNQGPNWVQKEANEIYLESLVEKKWNEKIKKIIKNIPFIFTMISLVISLTIFGLDYKSIRDNVTQVNKQLDEFEPKINEFIFKIHAADSLLNEIIEKKEAYDKDLDIHFSRLNDIYNRQINITHDYNEILKDAKNEYKSADSMLIEVKVNYQKSTNVLIKAIEKLREAEKNTSIFRDKASDIIYNLELALRKQETILEPKLNFLNHLQKIFIEQAKEIQKLKNELNALEIKFNKLNQNENLKRIK